jgi:recombination protein RecA
MEEKNRQKAIDLALASIEKEYGKGSIMRLKDGESTFQDVQVVSSGSIGLDIALGIGGYPRGRIIEIYGPESSGKTTLTLHAIAQVQKAGGVAAFIDAEHALDPAYARKLGVKTDELLVSQPDYGEQALEIADMLVRSNAVDIVVVDSVAALVPKAEIEGDMGDSHVGVQARLMSQALRKLTGTVARSNCMLVFINQIRMKIGVMFGSPETTTGGNALKFYASVRLDIRRIGQIKEAAASDKKDPVTIGNRTRVKVVKNKMAPPFREVEFDILYGQGISRAGDIIDLAVELGLVEKSGAWFSVGTERIGQGRENAKTYLDQHPQLMEKLEAQILAKHNIKPRAAAAEETPAPAAKKDGKDKAELAPDGKPVVKIPAATAAAPPPARNGAAAEEPKRAPKPAN